MATSRENIQFGQGHALRLQTVCRALRDADGLITSMVLENGFNQLSFFNRLFRREFNKSPLSYRNHCRAHQEAENGKAYPTSTTQTVL